jgi:hypothetical protein
VLKISGRPSWLLDTLDQMGQRLAAAPGYTAPSRAEVAAVERELEAFLSSADGIPIGRSRRNHAKCAVLRQRLADRRSERDHIQKLGSTEAARAQPHSSPCSAPAACVVVVVRTGTD